MTYKITSKMMKETQKNYLIFFLWEITLMYDICWQTSRLNDNNKMQPAQALFTFWDKLVYGVRRRGRISLLANHMI